MLDTNGQVDTTDNAVQVNTSNSLRTGPRGFNLLEDTSVRKKIVHFDHERQPERVVHALGHGAYGQFESYGDWSNITMACWLRAGAVSEVFARFSVVISSVGGSESNRDTHGFATKIYSACGNQDFVGNHLSSFFINDGAQFPDLIHAVKYEANLGFPTDGTAHPTAYDFFNLHPESAFQLMNVLSDLGLPRDPAHMAGNSISTYRFFNAEGKSTLMKWYWMPKAGLRSLVYPEVQKLVGKNQNFQRVELYNMIEAGVFPEWEFAVQLFPDDGTFMYKGYDLLIPTQIVPFEVVQPIKLGRLTLNRNPTNFFSEPENIAFSPGNVVDGVSWVPDPLLQWRLLSYDDTGVHRHGSVNYYDLPVNRPIVPIENDYRDGYMQPNLFVGDSTSSPNNLGGVMEPGPAQSLEYSATGETVGAGPIGRYTPMFNWFEQAQAFWGTMDIYAQQHTVDGYIFELGNVGNMGVVQRYINDTLNSIDNCLARRVAYGVGAPMPAIGSGPTAKMTNNTTPYPSLYPLNPGQEPNKTLAGLTVAVIADNALFTTADMSAMMTLLVPAQVGLEVVAPRVGTLATGVTANGSFITTSDVFYDAIFIGSSMGLNTTLSYDMRQFVLDSYSYGKAIAAIGSSGPAILKSLGIYGEPGVYTGSASAVTQDVMAALMGPVRFFQRFPTDDVHMICG